MRLPVRYNKIPAKEPGSFNEYEDLNMYKQSIVVTDPVGPYEGAGERVVHRTDYPMQLSDNSLRVELNLFLSNYIMVMQNKGWQAKVIEEPTYEWRKRVEAVDEYGRLRSVRDIEILEYWEGEI